MSTRKMQKAADCLLALELLLTLWLLAGCGGSVAGGWLQQPTGTAGYTTASSGVLPVQLAIPSIQVNAPIEPVAVAANGTMAMPQEHPWDDVGWYQAGTRPGEQGSAVIAGHLDRPGGSPAIFWNLRTIKIGVEIQIKDVNGGTSSFRVIRVTTYPPDRAPIFQIFNDASGKYLNLITCAGDWEPEEHQTSLRLVVYAVKE